MVVIGWIGYHNSFLSGLPYIKINKLQKVQNAAARPITNSLRYCHITTVLQELHWLPARFRINFKILLMKFKAIHGLASMRKKSPYLLRSNEELLLVQPSHLSQRRGQETEPFTWPPHIMEWITIEYQT